MPMCMLQLLHVFMYVCSYICISVHIVYCPLVSGYIGMWHHADHMLERSYCLNKLAHIYNGLPLQYSNVQISQFNPFHD